MSLLDVFMPEDLCARCAEEEPTREFFVTVTRESETVRLAFCGPDCKRAFVVGYNSIGKFPVG